ncbi:MAG: diguanylate cyclase [Nitrosomonadales bacterium]|nr:diguanylate cyclase [Nitrosomonadales bacterium]
MIFGLDYSTFFEKNLVAIFVIYGCSFFYLFLSILFSFRTLRTTGLAAAFSYLMLFALAHAIVEWMDMYLQYTRLVHGQDPSAQFSFIRLALLASSFLFLFVFGLRLNQDIEQISAKASRLFIGLAAMLFFLVIPAYFWNGLPETKELEIVFRNLLCFPATVIAGVGLYKLSRNHYENILPVGYDGYFRWCGYTFVAYGVLAGLVTPKGQFLLSPYINNESFFAFTGVPIQLFRTAAALFIAYLLIRAMALRISQRLLGVLSAFFVMFFILAFTGYISINVIGKSYEETVRLSSEQRDNAYLLRTFDRLYSASLSPSLSADKRTVADEYLRELGVVIGEIRSLHRDEGETVEMEKIDKIALILDRQASREDGLKVSDLDEIKTLLDSLVEMHQEEIDKNREAVAQNINNFEMLRIVLFLLSVAGFAFIGYTFHRILIRPLHALQTGATQIAEGNLGHRIHIGTADELQELAVDFNMMADSLLDKTSRLEKEAITDGLTGLFNHRHFYNRLEFEINRAARANSPLSVLILDVDNFKKYNDKYGHPKGDEVLRRCSAAIRESVRGIDIAARYGGEEFAVILAETDKKGAIVAAENIRRAIEELRFFDEEGDTTHNVTVSIGVSSYPADTKEMNDLVKKADDALYTAKREGKNRVCAHGG